MTSLAFLHGIQVKESDRPTHQRRNCLWTSALQRAIWPFAWNIFNGYEWSAIIQRATFLYTKRWTSACEDEKQQWLRTWLNDQSCALIMTSKMSSSGKADWFEQHGTYSSSSKFQVNDGNTQISYCCTKLLLNCRSCITFLPQVNILTRKQRRKQKVDRFFATTLLSGN